MAILRARSARIAHAWATLMTRLGYDRFLAQGSDWGTSVSTSLANLMVLSPVPGVRAPGFTLTEFATANGTQDLLFVTTKAGHIAALDAHTGAPIWAQQYPAGSCRINNNGGPCYTTSSPAIDPNRAAVA